MYIPRFLEGVVSEVDRTFRVLYLGGPRQAGKTTLLRHIAGRTDRRYVTLDDPGARKIAQTDPLRLLKLHPPPVLIDEAQYAPQLFPYIKMHVDEVKDRGHKKFFPRRMCSR